MFSEKTMAGRFYQRSFSENVLQVGDVFVLFVFNWFRSKKSLVLSCEISCQEYQFKASVNQQTYPMIYETVANEEILIECKESEWNKTIFFSFSIDKGILAFNLFSFYLGNLRWFLLTIGCSYWVQFSSEKRLWSGLLNLISIHSKSFWGKNTYNNFWTKKNRLWSCVALRSR